MTWLRRNRGLLLRWALFATLLAGLAWALDAALPPEPRWVLRGRLGQRGITPDGRTYITRTVGELVHAPMENMPVDPDPPVLVGPVQYRDVASGEQVAQFLGERGPSWQVVFSNDRSQLAALAPVPGDAGRSELRWIDQTTGRHARTVFEHPSASWQPSISPSGALLLLEHWDDDDLAPAVCVYETASLRLLAKATATNSLQIPWKWTHDGNDGNALYLYLADDNGKASLRRIAAGGETATALHGVGDWLTISPDGKTLVTWPADASDRFLLWDLPTGKRRGTIQVNEIDASYPPPVFTPDGRTLVITMGKGDAGDTLGVWDMDGARWLGKVRYTGGDVPLFVSPNAVVVHESDERLAYYQLRPFARLWQHEGKSLRAADVLPDAASLVVVSHGADSGADTGRRVVYGGDRLLLLDPQSGAPTLDVALDRDANHTWQSRGNHFVTVSLSLHFVAGERGAIREFIEDRLLALLLPSRQGGDTPSTTVRVFDIATGGERCRIQLAHAVIDAAAITPDGQSLVLHQEGGIGSSDSAVICYDIPPRRPWRFILGIPLGLGMTLLSVRVAWRRVRRARKQGQATTPTTPS